MSLNLLPPPTEGWMTTAKIFIAILFIGAIVLGLIATRYYDQKWHKEHSPSTTTKVVSDNRPSSPGNTFGALIFPLIPF
ncbi:MAG: hypothetical protein WCS86_00015 [Candidatus Paceibacterota bacterium]